MSRRSVPTRSSRPKDVDCRLAGGTKPHLDLVSEDSHDADQPGPSNQSDQRRGKDKRRVGTAWSFDECMAFYEALKDHGKNFEQIASYLERKKFERDKDQVRNFYFNTYKICRDKGGVEEKEWAMIPYAARELLVVLNALEWKKRTNSSAVQPHRFKSLMVTGSSAIKLPGKRLSVSIRTPSCTALHKFFPSRVPSVMTVCLTPHSYATKRYIAEVCQQNPLLSISITPQTSFSQLFTFLEQKWEIPEDGEEEADIINMTFYPPDDFKQANVEIKAAKETQPCLKTLKDDASRRSDSSETQYLDMSAVFEQGMTKANTADLNFLQLFFLFGESKVITLRYDIDNETTAANCFVKLCELFKASDLVVDDQKVNRKNGVDNVDDSDDEVDRPEPTAKPRQPNRRMADVVSKQVDVVGKERDQFKAQLSSLKQQARPRKRKAPPSTCSAATPSVTVDNSVPTDFSPLTRSHQTSTLTTFQHHNSVNLFLQSPPKQYQLLSPLLPHDDVAGGAERISSGLRDYSGFGRDDQAHFMSEEIDGHHGLLPSPSKSLMDDAFNLFDSMMDVSSNEFVSNFAQLAHQVNDSQSSLHHL